MAVTALSSTQLTALAATPKVLVKASLWKGKARREYLDFAQVTAGDIGSTIELVRLPAGRVRLNLYLSMLATSAFGASCTLAIGNRAYTGIDGVAVAEASASIKAAYSVASAANTAMTGSAGAAPYVDFLSKSGLVLFGTIAGAVIPDAATIKGFFDYQTD